MDKQPNSSKVYVNFVLWAYDFVVHFLSAKLAWKISTKNIHKHYFHYINKENHLDIGVGTGLFLEPLADANLRITIADINPNALAVVEQKLLKKGAKVNKVSLNLYERFNLPNKYQSIAMCYVFHCLEGDKQKIVEKVYAQLEDGGVFFGVTLVNDNNFNFLGKFLMYFYNKNKIFTNYDDTPEKIETMLRNVFLNIEIKREGRALFFVATKV